MIKGKIIATDLDGTLLYPKKKIKLLPKKTIYFAQKFHNDGGNLLIVSSRSSYLTDQIQKKLGFEVDSIGCNGAFVKVKNQLVYENYFEKNELKQILDYMKTVIQCDLILLSTRDHDLISNKTGLPLITNVIFNLYEHFQIRYKDPFVRSDHLFFDEIDNGHVYKAMCLVGITKKKKKLAMEANKILRERFPNAEFSWIGEFIEITPKGASKANGIRFYLDYLGISKDNIFVIGDNGNDISMFESFFENSYCMNHAKDVIKKHAKHTIERFSDLEDYLYPSEDKILEIEKR